MGTAMRLTHEDGSYDRLISKFRYLILGAQREGNRQLAQLLRPLGLTPSQAEILTVLSERDGLTLVELGRYIVCETGSPSRIVDNLVRRGLVNREHGQTDRRVVHLGLSPAGWELAHQVRDCDNRLNAAFSELLDEQELTTLVAVLRRIMQGTSSGAKVARRFSDTP